MSQSRRRIVLGLLALGAWSTHVLVMWLVYDGAPHELLWACHIAPVLLAAGCLRNDVRLTSVATCWTALGAPLWLGNLIAAAEVPGPTPTLVHLGALALSIAVVRTMGWDRGAWWRASVALLALAITTRLVSSAERHNVNLVFRIWPGFEPLFPSHAAFVAFVGASIPPALWLFGRAFEHLGARAARDPEAARS